MINVVNMGVNVSRTSDLSENELLQKFCSKEQISIENTEFWTNLLQYHIVPPVNRYNYLIIFL